MSATKIAVITGGHPFDVQPFRQLFRAFPGVDAYIQHTDEFVSEPAEVRDSYDALVFYSMFKDTPTDDVAWYAGRPRTALGRLGQTRQGIILLHHALLAYPDWAMWDDIAGMRSRVMRSFHQDERVRVEIADPQHPIADGMAPWQVTDETYIMDNAVMPESITGNRILFTTDNPLSMRAFGWTRHYKQARVFCFPSGHGHATYANASFRTVLQRGIEWVTGRI